MKSNKFLEKLIVAMLSVTLLVPATSFLDNSNNYAQAAKEGWKWEWGSWYYYVGGKPLKNTWKGDYYLKSDGKMARNEWVSKYLVGYDGRYVRNTWYLGWYFKSDGTMARNEWIYNKNSNLWSYVKGDGKYVWSQWYDDYYFDVD